MIENEDKLENILLNEYIIKLRSILGFSNLEDIYFISILLALFFFTFLVFTYFVIGSKSQKKNKLVSSNEKPTLNEIINKTDNVNISDNNNDNDFVDVLVAIEEEMAAVRELYVGGYITKGIYISETDRLYEKAKVFGL